MSKPKVISEEAFFLAEPVAADADQSVLRGVKLFDRSRNRNGRRYSDRAYAQLKEVYEGLPVNLGHAKKGESSSVYDRNGMIRNVREEGGAYYGDWHYNPHHPLTQSILWAAEHQPATFGFSHRITATTRRSKSGEIVEEVIRGVSLDLVCEPSTTVSIFESEEVNSMDLHTLKTEHKHLVEELYEEFREREQSDQRVKELQEQLDAQKAENDKLKAKLDAIEAKEAHEARKAEIAEQAKSKGLELTEEQIERYAKYEKEVAEQHLNDLAAIAGSAPRKASEGLAGPRSSSGASERKPSEKLAAISRYFRR